RAMSYRTRRIVLMPGLAGLAALLYWGLVGLPSFGDYRGPYGFVINRVATAERHMTNAVTAVVFDYRGFDTMGEEFILFAAVIGSVLLLRARGNKPEGERDWIGSEGVRTLGVFFAGPALVVGLWLVAF